MIPVSPVIPNKRYTEVVFAKDQPQYLPLPALKFDDGHVLTRWKLSFKERIKILLFGDIYLWLLTFGQPLQPVMLQVDNPDKKFSVN